MKTNNDQTLTTAVLAGVLFIALLAGCASGPRQAPESVGEDETVVAVPLVILDAQQIRSSGNFGYQINLENVRTGEIRKFSVYLNLSDGINYFRGIPEGEYLIKEYVPLQLSNATPKAMRIQQYLKVKKGRISILPAKLVMTLVDPDRADYSSIVYFDYYELSEAQQKQILDLIRRI